MGVRHSQSGDLLVQVANLGGVLGEGADQQRTQFSEFGCCCVRVTRGGKQLGDNEPGVDDFVGHLLRHGKTDVWIEATSSPDNPREAEADSFSRDTLISHAEAMELARLKTLDDARRFADRIGIAPGIVVGRLQHDNLWPYSQGNRLKRQLRFPSQADD